MSTLTPVKPETPALVTPKGLELVHLGTTIGTEVHGVDLTQPLSDETLQFLKALMLQRHVIFFRDQDISIERQIELCRLWGELEIIPFLPQHPDHPEVLHIKRDGNSKAYENVWHTDVTWRECPSWGSMLRAVEVPELGGDTLWCDMYAAYDNLSRPLKRLVEGLEAVHSITVGLSIVAGQDVINEMASRFPPQSHPVVRTHPETGRKALYVNRAHTSHLRGMRRDDSAALLELLYKRADNPEIQCRFKWRKNSIAFWDNRASQHYANADYFPQPREMYRVTIAGDKPF